MVVGVLIYSLIGVCPTSSLRLLADPVVEALAVPNKVRHFREALLSSKAYRAISMA